MPTIEPPPDEELLTRIGLPSPGDEVLSLYTTSQVAALLGVSPRRLRAWRRCGLIQPVRRTGSVLYFDFCQVALARTLSDLTRAGVSAGRVRRVLDQVRSWLRDAEQPLRRFTISPANGRLLVRTVQGGLAEPTGQFQLSFSGDPTPHLPMAEPPDAAAQADEWFRLANSLYASNRKQQAIDGYRQAVEIDPEFAEAWNNLGNVLVELDECDAASDALSRALAIDPSYVDAHYNLADCLERQGRFSEARSHWRIYAEHDPASPWGTYARARVGAVNPSVSSETEAWPS